MYHIAVYFDVPPAHRDDFIAAALEDGRNSGADEPGTQRFELIVDEEDPNRFYLNEGYSDPAAFDAHAGGRHFTRFFELIKDYAEGPTWLIKGSRIEEQVAGRRSRFAEETMKETLTLVAGFQAKPGQEDRLREALNTMVEPSEAEPGCLGYRPLADPNRTGAMVCLEESGERGRAGIPFRHTAFQERSRCPDRNTQPSSFTLRRLRPVPDMG